MRVAELMLLARATARGGTARLLEANNQASKPVPLDNAVRSRRAFFVTPRPELLVVDVDLPHDPTASADVLAAFDVLLETATRAGVPALGIPSGRPGHQHGYFVVGTGSARTRLERWARDAGMDVRTQGIRPPGAPHRTGATVWQPTDERDLQAVLGVLNSPSDPEATARLADRLCPLVLPGRIQTAVRHGYSHAGYASPSHARMALTVAVRGRGGPLALVEAILRDPTSPLGATFRERGATWQRAELSRLWDKAGAWITSGGRTDPRCHLDAVVRAAARAPWPGTAGGSDLAVLEELLRVARRAGVRTVGAALADLAVGAGVSVDTARVAVRRLEARGWVARVALETPTTTRTYDLRVPRALNLPDAPDDGSLLVAVDEFGDLGADVARRGALGKVSVRVARAVAAHPGARAAELAEMLSMTAGAVRFHLRKLARAGVAHAQRAGGSLAWGVAVTRDVVQDLAARLGVHGARARQAERVAAGRAVRAAARAAFARAHHAWRRHQGCAQAPGDQGEPPVPPPTA